MRWAVFAIFGLGVLIAQLSLSGVLAIRSAEGIAPDLVACLLVYIALFGQRSSVLWACWIMGIMVDLAPPEQSMSHRIVGQYALGYAFGGYVVLQLRTMVFRRRAITAGFLTFVFLLAASMVGVFLLAIRSKVYPENVLPNGALRELWHRILIALYSGFVGIPVGWALQRTLTLWGFAAGNQRRH